MTHVCVERLCAGHGKEHRSQSKQPGCTVIEQKCDTIARVDGGNNARTISDVEGPACGERDEPEKHQRSEHEGHSSRTSALHSEKCYESYKTNWQDVGGQGLGHEFQPFHCR